MATLFRNSVRTFYYAGIGFAMLTQLVQGQSATSADQPTFPSPVAADNALYIAIQNLDDATALKILGQKDAAMLSGDESQGALDRELFTKKYKEMHRLVREPDGAVILYIGAENWPFPFPLVSKNGAWIFDSDAGRDEVLFRRVGANESAAIQRLSDLALRKQENGATIDVAANDGPLYGYHFVALTGRAKNAQSRKKDFVFAAYPDAYRSCGVMTFIVSGTGVVYQKDLGPDTSKLVKTITGGTPGRGWHVAQ